MIDKAKRFVEEVKPHTSKIIWSNINQGVTTAFALAVSIVLTRLGSKELYGQYLFILGIFGLFSIISVPGVRICVFRIAAQGYDGVYRRATRFSFLWSLFGIPLLVITGIFIYLFKARMLGIGLITVALFFPFEEGLQNWILFMKGRSYFRRLAVYNSIKFFISLAAVTASIVFTGNIIVILAAYFLVSSGFNVFYHLKTVSSLTNDEVDEGWKRQSLALTIVILSTIIFGRVDIVLIGALLPFGEVFVYGLVMKFTDVFFRVIQSTSEAIVPNLYQSRKITIRYFYKFFLLSFLVPIILYPLIKYPVLILYGQDRECLDVIGFSRLYVFIIPFYFLNTIATHFMIKYKLNKEINLSRITSMIAVVVLYATLIPLYGIKGGVISSMLYFVIQLATNLFLLRVRKPKEIGG
ncbi:MAG: lipopolysaccharide biosynthesis protein [Planctomycetota bacterium]|jgi:O-antigen/teichoic acid export membrane protein